MCTFQQLMKNFINLINNLLPIVFNPLYTNTQFYCHSETVLS
jgi:hypothetical protein